jgi:hypothetical protein
MRGDARHERETMPSTFISVLKFWNQMLFTKLGKNFKVSVEKRKQQKHQIRCLCLNVIEWNEKKNCNQQKLLKLNHFNCICLINFLDSLLTVKLENDDGPKLSRRFAAIFESQRKNCGTSKKQVNIHFSSIHMNNEDVNCLSYS